MSFQTHNTFFTFWPCIDSNTTTTFKAQKGSKDIIKIVHVTSVAQPQCYEATRILLVCKENKNNDFIQQFLLLHVSLQHAFTTQTMVCTKQVDQKPLKRDSATQTKDK